MHAGVATYSHECAGEGCLRRQAPCTQLPPVIWVLEHVHLQHTMAGASHWNTCRASCLYAAASMCMIRTPVEWSSNASCRTPGLHVCLHCTVTQVHTAIHSRCIPQWSVRSECVWVAHRAAPIGGEHDHRRIRIRPGHEAHIAAQKHLIWRCLVTHMWRPYPLPHVGVPCNAVKHTIGGHLYGHRIYCSM